MASFFEKLRGSMGVEQEDKEEKEQPKAKAKKKAAAQKPAAEKKKESSSASTSTKAAADKKATEDKAKKVEIKSTDKEDIDDEEENKEEEDTAGMQQDSDWFEPQGELAVDVFQTNKDIIIQSTVAGVKPEDLDISVENDTVTISGERKNIIEEKDKNYFYQECFWGAFSRQIVLPEEVDGSQAQATIKDGVFTLRLPKIERKKVRKIKVSG